MPIINERVNQNRIINGDRAEMLVNRKAEEMNIKLESVPFKIPKPQNLLGRTLAFSNFFQVRQELGKMISIEGRGALGLLPFNDTEWLIRPFRVVAYNMVGLKETYVIGVDGSEYNGSSNFPVGSWAFQNSKHLTIYTEWLFINDVPTMRKYVNMPQYPADKQTEKWYLADEEKSFPGMVDLPVKIFRNNDKMVSDVVEYGVEGLLEQLDQLSEQYVSIWNMAKTKPYFNANLTDVDARETTENLQSGFNDFIEDDSFDSKLGAGVQILPGNASPQLLEQHIAFLTAEIEKQFGLLRDSMLTANQKNIIEILSKDEFAYEKTRIKRFARQIEYNDWFRKVCLYLNVKIIQPQLQVSMIDSWKEDMIEASVAQLKGSVNKQMIKAAPTKKPVEQGDENEPTE